MFCVNLRDERLGEIGRMNNGLSARIIEYRTTKSIDVEFENGIIAENREYGKFKLGEIACPLIIETINDYAKVTNINNEQPLTWLMDIEDLPLLDKYKWGKNHEGYISRHARNSNPRTIFLHRVVMNAPGGTEVDHRDGNKLDIRKQNLRLCTCAKNSLNKGARGNNTSGYKGVSWHPTTGKWRALIAVNRRQISLGLYYDKKDAARAYNAAALKYHGEFAKLNEI